MDFISRNLPKVQIITINRIHTQHGMLLEVENNLLIPIKVWEDGGEPDLEVNSTSEESGFSTEEIAVDKDSPKLRFWFLASSVDSFQTRPKMENGMKLDASLEEMK
jgi:hypothetical protein